MYGLTKLAKSANSIPKENNRRSVSKGWRIETVMKLEHARLKKNQPRLSALILKKHLSMPLNASDLISGQLKCPAARALPTTPQHLPPPHNNNNNDHHLQTTRLYKTTCRNNTHSSPNPAARAAACAVMPQMNFPNFRLPWLQWRLSWSLQEASRLKVKTSASTLRPRSAQRPHPKKLPPNGPQT